jgi:inhibitor of KinA
VTEALTFRPVGEAAVLVELGDRIDQALNERVVAIDSALGAAPPEWLKETIPAFASLLVIYDPLVTELHAVEAAVREAAARAAATEREIAEHEIAVCYEGSYAPDIEALGETLSLSPDQIAELHLQGHYRVFMYGFAPGYAYLGGVPDRLKVPRKPAAVRGHAVGSVMIAAGQCIVMPLPMPTGWWIIGRTATRILRPELADPFLFKAGDRVRFRRIGLAEMDGLVGR